MIIGLVGGEPELNEELGRLLEDRYQTTLVFDKDGLERHKDQDCVFVNVTDKNQAEWLHDEQGARLVYLEHPSNQLEHLQPLKQYCSFSIDSSGGITRTRRKLEMTLMGCC